MKKIFVILVAGLILAPTTFADDIPEVIDLSALRNCGSQVACEVAREATIAVLQQLIIELSERIVELEAQKIAESGGFNPSEEYLEELEENPLARGRSERFSVRDGEPRFSDDTHAVYQETWRIFSAVLTDEQRKLFDRISFTNDSGDDFAAFVTQEVSSRGREIKEEWRLSVNLADVAFDGLRDIRRSVEILVHEAAHVWVLSGGQLDYFVDDEDDCRSYYLHAFEACAEGGSYYDYFHDNFWDEEFYEWAEIYRELVEDRPSRAQDELEDYFRDRRDEFVGPYAATSPDEDIAESLMTFILNPAQNDDDLKDVKADAFYEFPEILAARAKVRAIYDKRWYD